jgi:hypothetical protein
MHRQEEWTMNRQRPYPRSIPVAPRRPLWLAAIDGRRTASQRMIAPIDEPETPLTVEFVGLTPEEQRAALAAFPGGRRFRLADTGN